MNALVTGTSVKKGAVTVTYTEKGEEKSAEFDRLIVAVGRRPRTKDLFSSDSGVTMDERGFVFVNDYCATEAPGVWAIGDIVRGLCWRTRGQKRALWLQSVSMASPFSSIMSASSIIYTHPEIAAVVRPSKSSKQKVLITKQVHSHSRPLVER